MQVLVILMIGVIFVLLFIIWRTKRGLRGLQQQVMNVSKQAQYGQRFYLTEQTPELRRTVDRLNQLLDDYERRLKAADRVTDTLDVAITGLSHDLRTPLTAIKGYINLLAQSSDEKQREQYLATISQATDRLENMLNQLYDLARLNQNNDLTLTSFDLQNSVIENFVGLYETFEQAGIVVEFTEPDFSTQVVTDENLVNRVLQNIAQNVSRYGERYAEISYQRIDDWVSVTVANGVAPDAAVPVDQIFNRFYRADTSRTQSDASGIGLFMAKELTERLGGELVATYEPGRFTMTLRLPI